MTMRYIILISFCYLAVISCKKQDTVWEADWSAPLINDTLSLENLVNDTTLTTSSGIYHLELRRTLFDLNIAELVEIKDTTVENIYSIGFSSVNVPPGTSFVNEAQEFSFTLNALELKKIVLSQGFIDVRLGNPVGTTAIYTISLPGVSKNGVSFNETYEVPQGTLTSPSYVTKTLDLTGYEFDLTGVDGTQRNKLRADISVKSDPDGPSVTVTNSHEVEMDVTFRDVGIDYAFGYFGNQVLSDTTKVNLDVMDMIQNGTIDLPASTVKFELENGIKVTANALVSKVSGTNNSGTTVDLNNAQIGTAFNVNPATGTWSTLTPSTKVLEFNESNSNIEEFLENLSSRVEVGYKMQLNPWGNVSGGTDELFPHSRLRVNLCANMPLTIGLDNLVVADTFDFDMEQNTSGTHVTKGTFFLEVSNAFPFSAEVALELLDENGNVLHTVLGSEIIQSGKFGTVDVASGLTVMDSDVTFDLPENVVADLSKIKLIHVRSVFNSIDPLTNTVESMSVPEGAFMSVKLRSRFTTENHF